MTLEAKTRRLAQRLGYALQRSRTRTPELYEFGRYRIIDPGLNAVVWGCGSFAFELTIEQAFEILQDHGAAA